MHKVKEYTTENHTGWFNELRVEIYQDIHDDNDFMSIRIIRTLTGWQSKNIYFSEFMETEIDPDGNTLNIFSDSNYYEVRAFLHGYITAHWSSYGEYKKMIHVHRSKKVPRQLTT